MKIKKPMTKEEILKIISQNRDVLTPENYQRILKNADVFTDDEKKAIADYLRVAHELVEANHRFMAKQNALFQKSADRLKSIDGQMSQDIKKMIKDAEHKEGGESSSAADRLLSDL
jgi:hypothetical protein